MASADVSGTAIASQNFSLICTATKTVDGLMNLPTAMWFIGGTEVTTADGIEIIASSNVSVSTLIFNPLRTSHATSDAQIYSCQASISSPVLNLPWTTSVPQIVSVKSKYMVVFALHKWISLFPPCSLHPNCDHPCSLWYIICWHYNSSQTELQHFYWLCCWYPSNCLCNLA